MREKTNGNYGYSDSNSGYSSSEYRRPVFGRDYRSNARQMREHFGERVGHFGDGIERLGERVGRVGGEDGSLMRLHERIWSKLYFVVGVGVIALIVLAVALLLGLIFPRSGFVSIIRTIGWWVMIISAGIIALGWIAGWICKFFGWASRR